MKILDAQAEYKGIPEKIQVGHLTYTVQVVDLVDDTEGKVGACHEAACAIYVRDQCSMQNIKGILLHELTHAVLQVFSPGLDEIKKTIDRSPTLVDGEQMDEVYTRIIELGFMIVFTNNPGLAKWLGWTN